MLFLCNVADNCISDSGATAIANALSANNSLQKLFWVSPINSTRYSNILILINCDLIVFIADNQISDGGATAFANVLSANKICRLYE